jgi:Zn-dependent protease
LFQQFDLVDFLITLLALIFSVAIHEFAHAWTALQLGDRTPYYEGRVTLHPAAHLDPMGTMMMVVSAFTGFGIGWGKPVRVNPYNLKYGPRVGGAITAAAGPISNILQAVFWGIPLRLAIHDTLSLPDLAVRALTFAFFINIGLALFNLIPLFPLDGFSIVRGIVSTIRTRWAYDVSDFLDRIQPYAPMVLFLLIFLDQSMPGYGPLDLILREPAERLAGLILGVSF